MLIDLFGSDIFRKLLLDFILLLISLLAGYASNWLRQKTKTEKAIGIQSNIRTKRDYAILAVNFVEQAYNKHNNDTKFNLARDWLRSRCEGVGINLTDGEIKGLIESALKEIKDALNK